MRLVLTTKPAKAVFISDVHLGSLEEPKSVLFMNLLERLYHDKRLTHVFLLGDIFDLWVGKHTYFVQKYANLIEKFKDLVEKGVEVHYFEGNHDLYLNDFWGKQIGMNIHPGPASFQIGCLTVRAEHGDQMDPEDHGYIFLRWLLRSFFMRWAIRLLPSWAVIRIGERASAASRDYTTNTKTMAIEEAHVKMRAFAAKTAVTEKWDYLIAGHLHVNEDHEFKFNGQNRRLINLGSWMSEPLVFWLDGEKGAWEKLS